MAPSTMRVLGGLLPLLLLLVLFGHTPAAEEWTPEIIQQVTNRRAIPLAMYVDNLPTPTKIFSYIKIGFLYIPIKLTIGMYQTTMKFHRDLPPTTVFAYGTSAATATFPGPTVEAVRWVPTFVTWENNLPLTHVLPVDTTISAAAPANGGVPAVVHLHGGVVAPASDGSAFAWYTANYVDKGPFFTTKTYTYPNVQHAGNLMYHDHALGLTRVNILAGLLGAYVIREPSLEQAFNLPKGDPYDLPLVIADRSFNVDGSIYMNKTGVNPDIHPSWRPEYFGEAITVNGKIWPYLIVQRRKYRFRIMNASNARYLNLSIANGAIPFTVIGSDSSFLAAPVTTPDLVVSVAEIFDVVVDFTNFAGATAELTNSAPYPFPAGPAIPGPMDSKVMQFNLLATAVTDPSTVPTSLVTNYEPALASDATVTRYIALHEYFSSTGQTMHLLINGKRLLDPATETPRSGTTELWHVINLTGDDHPLHLHLAHFQAVKMQALLDPAGFKACMDVTPDPLLCNITGQAAGAVRPVPEYEKTWKNVVKLPPSYVTSVVVKFKFVDSNLPYPFDPTPAPGYVYHCHILDHEDNEMIRPLKIVP